MFVARSTPRIRRARLVFLALGLAPTVSLVAWAMHLRGDAHRAAVERRWQDTIGVPLAIERVEYPRPGVIRAHGCVVPAAGDRMAVALPLVEVESAAGEVRVRIGRLGCDRGAAALAVDLGRCWLDEAVRFRKACVIEVADFSWSGWGPAAECGVEAAASLRVECVALDGTRAVRIVRRGGTDDEVRIVRRPAADRTSVACEIDASCAEPVPLDLLALATGGLPRSPAANATVSGTLHAACSPTGWEGQARGRIVDLDLAMAAATLGDGATGTATIEISRLTWSAGRVSDALVECTIGRGRVDRRLFDRVVLALSARPGPAAARARPAGMIEFDAAACIVAVGPQGVQVQPSARLPTGLAIGGGELLLIPPSSPVTADRVAWLFSSPGTAYGPTAGPGAWLMSVLPAPPSQPAATDEDPRF